MPIENSKPQTAKWVLFEPRAVEVVHGWGLVSYSLPYYLTLFSFQGAVTPGGGGGACGPVESCWNKG